MSDPALLPEPSAAPPGPATVQVPEVDLLNLVNAAEFALRNGAFNQQPVSSVHTIAGSLLRLQSLLKT